MLLTGAAFLVFWILMSVLNYPVDKSALITAIIFLIIGLIFEYHPWKP